MEAQRPIYIKLKCLLSTF